MPDTGWAYIRVSTDRQVDSALGIRGYVESVLRYAAAYGIDLGPPSEWSHGDDTIPTRERVLIETEGQSAYKKLLRERPKGRELCRSVEPGHLIIFPTMSRAFRQTRDCAEQTRRWHAIGVRFTFLDMPMPDPLMLHICAVFAEMESRTKAERGKAAHRVARAEGRPIGGRDPDAGFTWKRVGKRRYLIPDPVELATILQVRGWMRERHGYREIWSKLFNLKIKTPAWPGGKGQKEYGERRIRAMMHASKRLEKIEQQTGKRVDAVWHDPEHEFWKLYRSHDIEQRDAKEARRARLRQRKEWHRYQLEMQATG